MAGVLLAAPAESSPYSAYWSVREEADGVGLGDLYEQLALEVADSAAAVAAQRAAASGYSIVVPGVNDPTTSEALSWRWVARRPGCR